MKKRRLLAWLMTLVMMVGLMPATALAETASTAISNDYVSVDKTATRTGADTWKITMTVTAKDQDVKPEPLELVILMDTSGSMEWDIEGNKKGVKDADRRITIAGDAAQDLIKELCNANVNAKVAVYSFDGTAHKISPLTQLTNDTLSTIQGKIPDSKDDLYDGRGTNITAGLKMVAGLSEGTTSAFSGATDNKVIVLLGDGDPNNDDDDKVTNGAGPSDATIKSVKDQGIIVHTIGFAQHVAALERIANGTNGNYYTADDTDELADAFKQIKDSLTAMVVDNMGTLTGSDVTLTGTPTTNNGTAEKTNDGNMKWNPANGELAAGETATITYTVTAKDLDPGTHTINLNGNAVLSYQPEGGTADTLEFPTPTATVEVGQLVEHYMLDEKEVDTVTHTKFIVYGDNNSYTVDADASNKIPADATYIGSENADKQTIEVDENDQATIEATVGGKYHVYHNYVSVAAPTVEKDADKANAKEGDTINYTVTVKNEDLSTRTFVVTDTFFKNGFNITVQIGGGAETPVTLTGTTYEVELEPEQVATITYAYEVTSADAGKDLVNNATATVKGKEISGGDEITIPVEANEGELDSSKFVATANPGELTSGGTVPTDVAYATKDGDIYKVDLPEKETVKVLFGVEVENDTTSGLGETKTFDVVDTDTEYVGYKDNNGTAAVTPNATGDGATVRLDAGEKVTLYFVKEFATAQTFKNVAVVDETGVEVEVQIGDKATMLTIEKDRIAKAATEDGTEPVAPTLPDGVDLGDETPNYEPIPVIGYTADGEITLLYKVTVENVDENISTSNIMFFNTTEPEGLKYVVTDDATYVGYDATKAADEGIEDGALPVPDEDNATNKTDKVTGYLKYGQSIDLYFVKTFTADEILAAKGNAVNTAYLTGDDTGNDGATTQVTVNKSVLDSRKYLVEKEPTLTSGEVPSDVVYEAKLPEGEKIKLLFAVEVENDIKANAGEQKTFVVEDDATKYIGYATTATAGVTVEKKTNDSATVTLDAGKTVTLYFVMEVDASKVDTDGNVTNSATVDGVEKEITIPVVDKGNVLSIKKVRVDSNTANVPDALQNLDGVNYTPATANNPLEVADGGSVKLLYKVTVENNVPVKEQLLALFAAEAPVYNGKDYIVYDEGATYVGCYKYGNAEIAEPAVDTTAAKETVKGTLKETEKIDLYFTKKFTNVSGNVTNNVTLTGANTGGDSETTPVKLTVTVDFDLGYAGAVKGEAYKDQVIEKGTTATKPVDPTRTGYDFKGWFTTADGNEKFDFTAPVNKNETVYAQWVPEGQLTKDSITKTRVTLKDAETMPMLNGVNATDITYGDVVFDKDTDTVTLLYKVTVTNKNAVETKARTLNPGAITYKVVDEGAKYVAYEGKTQPNADYGASEVTGTLEANETVTLYFAKEFTREQVEALENNKYQVTNTADLYDGNTKVDSATEPTPVTLKVTVTFDTHGGTTVPSQEIVVGTTATKPATDPTKEGYDFVGWYTAEKEGAEFVFANKIYEDTTVHAQWIPKGHLTADSIVKTKVGLAEAQDMPMLNGVNATDITYGDVVFNTKADKVTLLYTVTVTNNNDAALPKMRTLNPGAVTYTVVDDGAKYVAYEGNTQPETAYGASTVTGTLEAYETITLYFAKEFTYADAVKLSDGTYQVENTAKLYWNDEFVGNDPEPTPAKLKEEISITKTSSVNNAKRNTWVEYTIVVENTGLTTLMGALVTETPDETVFDEGEFVNLPAGVKFVEGSNDEVEIDELGVDGKVTLTYKAKVKSNAQKNATLKNTVEAAVPNGPEAEDTLEQGKVYVPSSGGGGNKKPEIVAGDVEEILNTEDHFQYVQGYPDGTVGPERNITRAEATVIFFRLLQDHVRAELLTAENNFPDVNLDDWFNLGISTMESGGFVSGYEDGYFRPNGYITRAELATIISNFDDLEPVTENRFPDVEGHWAEAYINSAAEKGWLSGYDDGLYRPNQYITRAETMSMINRVLNRRVDADGLHADAKQWVDNPESKWYYYAVLEATNHHDYQRADVSDYENWTAINPEKIWEN